MINNALHLYISLQPDQVMVAYEESGPLQVRGLSPAEVKQKALEAATEKYGPDCEVSFSYIYVEEEYQQLYEKAINLMLEKHRGQVDKAGKPYYGHLIRVSQDVFSGKLKIIGLLHDIIEDTDVTAEMLLSEGFTPEIVDAVVAMSHKKGDSYEQFIEQVAKNELATMVKLSDLEDNMNIFRLPEITEDDRLRLNKYLKAHRRLMTLIKTAENQP